MALRIEEREEREFEASWGRLGKERMVMMMMFHDDCMSWVATFHERERKDPVFCLKCSDWVVSRPDSLTMTTDSILLPLLMMMRSDSSFWTSCFLPPLPPSAAECLPACISLQICLGSRCIRIMDDGSWRWSADTIHARQQREEGKRGRKEPGEIESNSSENSSLTLVWRRFFPKRQKRDEDDDDDDFSAAVSGISSCLPPYSSSLRFFPLILFFTILHFTVRTSSPLSSLPHDHHCHHRPPFRPRFVNLYKK